MSIRSRLIQASLAVIMVAAASPSHAVQFPNTSDRGAPARGPSLGTRGEICLDPTNRPSLTSLLPHNAIATAFGANTDIPMSLWFYIPDNEAAGAELTIVNELGDTTYQQTVELPSTSGTIQLKLPQYQADGVTPTFESGSLYYWDFALICDPNDRGDDVLLGGGIQRIDASTEFLAQLDAVADDLLAQAELYATAGAWQETITLAASLRTQNPDAWSELLSSVDLDALADKPIVGPTLGPTLGSTAGQQSTEPTAEPTTEQTTGQPEPVADTPTSSQGPTAMPNRSGDLQRLLEGINP